MVYLMGRIIRYFYDKVQMTKDLNSRMEKARLTMSLEEVKKEETKVLNDLALKYGDRIGKVCASLLLTNFLKLYGFYNVVLINNA